MTPVPAKTAPPTSVADAAVKGLKVLSLAEIEAAHNVQQQKYQWTLSDEREFIENLFCQRVNFLLVAYSLFVTAAASTNSSSMLVAVTAAGTMACAGVGLTIYRACFKLILTLRALSRLSDHPVAMMARETSGYGVTRLFPVNSILGVHLPAFCTVSLAAAAVAAWFGALAP